MPLTDVLPGSTLKPTHRPDVSILIAARNEEATLPNCLRAISQLQYPPGTVEVLIGNDSSTDNTSAVAATFINDNPDFHLIDVTESRTGLVGKANVLAQLAWRARGRLFLFTDADTQVPASWSGEMSQQFVGNVGIVTGITLPQGPTLFHKLQTIDWLYNLTLAHVLSSLGIPVTAMGNNMAVSREAYEQVGGYERLPVSVVEDYALFKALVGVGYEFKNLLSESVLAITKPVDTLRDFLHQRKRWMQGATDLPAWIVAGLYGQYLAGPLLFGLFLLAPVAAVGLYVLKLFLQTLVISFGLSRLRQTNLWPYVLLFEIYQLIIGPVSVVFYLLPTRIEWKGRHYS
ncbi:glycosyltransferase [Spirosoma soli]|uniref:Glycosyltransferase n=1 Tax=Spirosoma soli TaxID=1770529 RepID=A0ABW5M772_9BACT